jgi:multidrug efflux pump subunit AcrB
VRIVRFGVQKPVPVNLIMLALLFSGLWMGLSLRREFFPEVDPNQALISISYPGATPEEVEESLAIKVEEKLADLTREVKEVHSTLQEGGGGITVE